MILEHTRRVTREAEGGEVKRTMTARQAGSLARFYYLRCVEARSERLRRLRAGEPTSGQEVNFYAGMFIAQRNIARLLTGRQPHLIPHRM